MHKCNIFTSENLFGPILHGACVFIMVNDQYMANEIIIIFIYLFNLSWIKKTKKQYKNKNNYIK